jgi:hypothetical protein
LIYDAISQSCRLAIVNASSDRFSRYRTVASPGACLNGLSQGSQCRQRESPSRKSGWRTSSELGVFIARRLRWNARQAGSNSSPQCARIWRTLAPRSVPRQRSLLARAHGANERCDLVPGAIASYPPANAAASQRPVEVVGAARGTLPISHHQFVDVAWRDDRSRMLKPREDGGAAFCW